MENKDYFDDLEKYFPIDLLTEDERKYASDLNQQYGYTKSVKYIKSIRNDFGLKSARIYYDLYINNDMTND